MQSHGRIDGNYKPILPCGRRVLLRPHETPDYQGKIILPDSAKTMVPTTGVIMALGFDLEIGNPYKEGDAVVFSKYAGVELTFGDGVRVAIVHEDDILGIMNAEVEAVAS
jgi:co-chaperonin GroES (HSP10)